MKENNIDWFIINCNILELNPENCISLDLFIDLYKASNINLVNDSNIILILEIKASRFYNTEMINIIENENCKKYLKGIKLRYDKK